MTQAIKNLYNQKDGGELTYKECKAINKELALIDIENIPLDQRKNVEDYLTSALNMESVDHSLISSLEALLVKLQSCTE